MKSMTETNSGKLVSLISADLFSIERGLSFAPLLFAAPFVNMWACYWLAVTVGWEYALIVVGVWMFQLVLQYWSSVVVKNLKQEESGLNDERLKSVSDMVVGSRTIKCYGWEHHYIDRIRNIRVAQMSRSIRMIVTQSLGVSFFPNFGLIAVLIILLIEWSKGNKLENNVIVSMLSMVYFIFFSINNVAYFGLTNLQNFLAIVGRLSTVFEMEEYKKERQVATKPEEVTVKFKDCSFSWGFRVLEKQQGGNMSRVQVQVEDKAVIDEVSFDLKHDDLLVVIGSVGAGKTTLLHSVLEETKMVKGEKTITGTVAYVEQEPFIFSASIKDNILMGKVYDQQLFQKAIEAS
jgi:ATP-binding cassette subfamily C (CFTR/MRP) protein 4